MGADRAPDWAPEPFDRLLAPPEVAARLGVSPASLRDWRHMRRGPPYVRLPNRQVRYSERELMAWVRAAQEPLDPEPLEPRRRRRLTDRTVERLAQAMWRWERRGF